MPLTRTQKDKIYENILSDILEQDADSLLRKALKHEGYTDYLGMVLMSDNDIETITYVDDKTKQTVPLMKAFCALLKLLTESYYEYREDIGDPIDIFSMPPWKSIGSLLTILLKPPVNGRLDFSRPKSCHSPLFSPLSSHILSFHH